MKSPRSRPTLFSTAKQWLGYLSLSFLFRWGLLLFLSYFLWKNWHDDLPVEYIAQQYASPDSRMLRIDDMDVHCRISGKGESILLLHDAQSSLQTWDAWSAALSDKYKVIRVDLPGFGLTGPHPRGSSHKRKGTDPGSRAPRRWPEGLREPKAEAASPADR